MTSHNWDQNFSNSEDNKIFMHIFPYRIVIKYEIWSQILCGRPSFEISEICFVTMINKTNINCLSLL